MPHLRLSFATRNKEIRCGRGRRRKLKRMKRADKNAVANRFNKLDFHDDNLTRFTIHPPRDRNNFTRIEFELQEDSTGAVKVLSFHTCANLRFLMDFDVLADNWYGGNTESSIAKTDVARMRKFVRAQMSHWRTAYMPPTPMDKTNPDKTGVPAEFPFISCCILRRHC